MCSSEQRFFLSITMKKTNAIHQITFSFLILSLLASFGGCQDDRLLPEESHNITFSNACQSDNKLLEATFLDEKIINATQSEYTFISDEPTVSRKIKFTHLSGVLDPQSTIALTEDGSLDSFSRPSGYVMGATSLWGYFFTLTKQYKYRFISILVIIKVTNLFINQKRII